MSRQGKAGRPTPRLNLFTGLLRDARDGGGLYVRDKHPGQRLPVLVGYRAVMGVNGSRHVSFPLIEFEREVLSWLREIDPREVLPGNGAAERVLTLTGKLADIESRIEGVKAQLLDGGDLGPLVDVLRKLDARRATAADELAAARREATSPLATAWGECRSLADVLDGAPDPEGARTRLRAALRRVVESVWCLFVAKGVWRIAAVQIRFAGGACRSYMIVHRPAKGNQHGRCRPAQTWTRSFAEAAPEAGEFDLRRRKDARALEAALNDVDLVVDEAAPPGPAQEAGRTSGRARKRKSPK
jgi:hypothetical protein